MSNLTVVGCLEETLDTLSYYYFLGGKVDNIITLSKNRAIKAKISNWVDLNGFANKHNIPVYYVNHYNMKTKSDFELVKKLNPDLMLVIGWQRLIPENIIQLPSKGVIGFHGSSNFLPWGRGRSPINWSIIEGRNRFILHMFFITPGIDSGKIIGFEIYEITSEDNCRSVYYKTAMAQAILINRFLDNILAGNCQLYPQSGVEFYYPKRTPDDGKINWNLPALEICKLIRAVTHPYPGAFSLLKGEKIFFWRCQYFGDDLITVNSKPGEVLFISTNKFSEIAVKCGKGSILINEYDSKIKLKQGDIFEV